MEFWNRNVRSVWSLDGTAPGPGPVLTPDLIATDGRLAGDPGYGYAVIDNGLSIAGTTRCAAGRLRLVRIAKPLRLRESLAGVFNDGWIGSKGPAGSVIADYNKFVAPKKPGTVFVTLSRKGFCGPHAPGHVLIEVGTIALGQQRDGILGRVTQQRGWVIDSCGERTFPIETPGGPFHVKVTVAPPFQPRPSIRGTSSGATSARSSAWRSNRPRADHRRLTSASGCLRANRAMPRRCQRVWRERNFLSITAA